MKTLFIILLFSIAANAAVTLEHCQEDALQYGNHKDPLKPLAECVVMIKADSGKIEASSADGLLYAFGSGNMFYVDSKDADGNIIERNLVAGDQTELKNIQKIFIDQKAERIYVIQVKNQKNEMLVFDLTFLGNVTPKNLLRSQALLSGAISVKAIGTKEIEIVNAQGTFRVNADAESRSTRSRQVALVIKK